VSRLFQKLEAGEMALGVWLKGGPSWVATLARAGFDFVRPDMMFSAIDWRELDHIHKAALAVGLTTWVRVPANPWLGGTGQLQVTVDVARAFSLGIPIVGASIASAEQVRACVEVAKDWHRSGAGEYPNSNESFAAMNRKDENVAVFVPHVEAGTAIREIDDILAIDGLRIVMLAMTDLSKALGFPFQYDHPEVWRTLDRIVARARERNIVIAANMGYAYTTREQMRDRVAKMHAHGVRICLMQGADSMLENLAKQVLVDVRGALSR
jgi:2-keto-3-deoxy-L-rhamnonate aldolase RhmA